MLNPLMLLGLLALGIPVIIHLIQRQRLKPQVLATLQFLDAEDTANAFAPVPRDWLQLLLRLALLALFVLLMSRFVVTGDKVGPRTLAVVLDQSLGMQRLVEGNQTLFEKRKKQALELVEGLGPDDKMNFLLVGDRVTLETGYTQDRGRLREAVEGSAVSDSGALALVPALRASVRQLASRCEVNACVLVFSDHQQATYAPYVREAGAGGAGNVTLAFRDELDANRVKLVLIDERKDDERQQSPANLSVEQARFSPGQVHVGASSRLTAVVRNHSDKEQTTNVRLVEGETSGPQRSLTLAPGEAAHIDLVQRFESTTDSACRVEIDGDALPGDDRFYLPMRIRERRKILLVAPAPASPEERSSELSHRGVDLLSYALNPGEALGKGAGTAIQVKRVTPQTLAREALPFYSLVILYGVTDLAEQSAKDLATFVRNGGGIWLIPDRDVAPLRFNEAFAGLLNGLKLGAMKQLDTPRGIDRAESSVTHPLFQPLLREEWGNTRDIVFQHYYGLQAPGTAEVALRTAGGDAAGDPLAVLIRQERGLVYLQLFPGGLDSSSLPRTSAFVPMVQQTAALLGQRGERDRPDVLRVGEVLRINVPEFRTLKGDVKLEGPVTRTFPLTGLEDGEVRVEGLLQAGAYKVSHPQRRTERSRWLTVNPVLGASDLTPLSPDDQASLFGNTNVAWVSYADLDQLFLRRHELFGWLLGLVLAAFVIEAVLGAWQARRRVRTVARERVPA
jgi:hypothetical protein